MEATIKTKINLVLGEHCIETESKNEFKRLMDQYFDLDEGVDGSDLEEKIELLRRFIEESDFLFLRGRDERLSGELSSNVVISGSSSGKIDILFQ